MEKRRRSFLQALHSKGPLCHSQLTMIELRKVTKEFSPALAAHSRKGSVGIARPKRSITALNDISLRIGRGELCAVVGPSGSGKSTMLNLIGGLDRPTKGEILVDSQVLSGMTDRELTLLRRDRIGFVFQFFNLLPTLTSFENITLPLHLRGWPRAKACERGYELLELVGLGERSDHLPDELSGGERQRVAIARALSVYPPILLGDEPTGNLDTATGVEILKLLQQLHERFGTTVVIVTHNQNVAASCTRTVRMRDGKIEEDILR